MKSPVAKFLAPSLAGAWLVLAPAAFAQTAGQCVDMIAVLESVTEATSFTGRNAAKDEAALREKLRDAGYKLVDGKTADAAQKVSDYLAKLDQLLAAGKVDPLSYQALDTGGEGVLACIASIP